MPGGIEKLVTSFERVYVTMGLNVLSNPGELKHSLKNTVNYPFELLKLTLLGPARDYSDIIPRV